MPTPHDKPSPINISRVRSARKIAPLLSWRHLRELPWVFRIAFLLIGVIVLGFVIAFALIPLFALMIGLLG